MLRLCYPALRLARCAAPVCLALLSGCGDVSPPAPLDAGPAQRGPDAEQSDGGHLTAQDVPRPPDFVSAVARIEQYRDRIRDSLAAGRPAQAHRPLDEAAFVLEWLPEIARDSGIDKSHWEEINTLAQSISAAFDQIHTRIDEQGSFDYATVAERVQQAIDRLKALAALHPAGTQP
jgi:hypothetical protein